MFRGDLKAVDDRPLGGRVVVFASGIGFGELTAGRPATFRARVGRAHAARPHGRGAFGDRGADASVGRVWSSGSPRGCAPPSPMPRARCCPPTRPRCCPRWCSATRPTLTAPTVDEFRVAGLTHLTAVSGANVTIVCGAVLLTAGVVGPRAAVGMAGLALLAFVVVVQPSASVLRAAVMGAITLLAIVSHRRRQAIPALSATVVILMIGAPQLAVDVGFALSVSATAALVVIAPVWSRRLVDRGWPKPLADAVSVAVAAQLVTAPLVAGMSGTVSLVSVAANLAVAVVIAPITVIGTAAAAVSAFWPAAAQFLVRFTGPELWWLLRVARWASAVPGARRAGAVRRRRRVLRGGGGNRLPSCCGGGGGDASAWRPRWSACWRGHRGRRCRPGRWRCRRDVTRSRVSQLHLVLGDEELLVERAVGEVLRSARDAAGTVDVPVDRLRAGEVSTSELAELLSPSLFADERVVVLEAAAEAGKDAVALIADAAADLPPGTMLVVVHSGGGRAKALADQLEEARRRGAPVRQDHQGPASASTSSAASSGPEGQGHRRRRSTAFSTPSARISASWPRRARSWSPTPAGTSTRRRCAATTAARPR